MATNGTLSASDRKKLLGPQLATPFDQYDRLFPDFRDGDVFAYDWESRQIKEMLGRSGKARSVEQVLTLPLRGAAWEIQGKGEAADFVRAQLGDKLGLIVDQMTAACTFKKAFFELVWKLDGGRVVYDSIQWRPPASCEAAFDPKTGNPNGFRQRVAHPNGLMLTAEGQNTLPGYVRIPANRSFIYTHGIHREPVFGVSDMDVAYWAYETCQKILFLWFQYLEKQSLPNAIVYGNDPTEADENAQTVADMKAGGVIGLPRPSDPTAKAFELLESSGKGADQFVTAIKYLETNMVASVLAGFTELADNSTASRVGSYALSADQSEFFLASRQAVADEMAASVNDGLIKPLVTYNFGDIPSADMPKLSIGPLANKDTDRALEMLKAIIAAPQLNVPGEFVDQLVTSTASYLGLDEQSLANAVDQFAKQRAAVQDQAAKAVAEQARQPRQPGAQAQSNPTTGQPTIPKAQTAQVPQAKIPGPSMRAGAAFANMADAADVAYELVNRAQAGEDPAEVLEEITGR